MCAAWHWAQVPATRAARAVFPLYSRRAQAKRRQIRVPPDASLVKNVPTRRFTGGKRVGRAGLEPATNGF